LLGLTAPGKIILTGSARRLAAACIWQLTIDLADAELYQLMPQHAADKTVESLYMVPKVLLIIGLHYTLYAYRA